LVPSGRETRTGISSDLKLCKAEMSKLIRSLAPESKIQEPLYNLHRPQIALVLYTVVEGGKIPAI